MANCDYAPEIGDMIDSFCQCGHLVLAHGAAGCALCSVEDRLKTVEERLEGIIENHSLWDGS